MLSDDLYPIAQGEALVGIVRDCRVHCGVTYENAR